MLRYLAYLSEWIGPLRVFENVPFRAVIGLILSFVLSLLVIPPFIRWMRQRAATEDMGKDSVTLETLHASKRGTPTMGGVVLVSVIILTAVLVCDPSNPVLWVGVGAVFGFGALGFVDDWMKLRGYGNRGLTVREKLLWQVLLSLLVAFGIAVFGPGGEMTKLLVPFTKWETFQPDLGGWYFIVIVLVLVATTNAVNLTDGLDGLASGCVVMAAMAYAVLAFVMGNAELAGSLRLPVVEGASELAILCAITVGATLGFLWFNAHPARLFMGDTGSLALGAVIGFTALLTKHELVLIVIGGIFFAESISVILQVGVFRLRKRRVFKCAPLHHHLEFSGWDENHVVVRLWMIGGMLTAAGLATLKMH